MLVQLTNIFKVPKKREPVPVPIPVALLREEKVEHKEEIVVEEEFIHEEEVILEEEVLPEEEEISPEEEVPLEGEEEEVLPEEDAVKLNSFAPGREMVGPTCCRDHSGSRGMKLNLIKAMQFRRTSLLKAEAIP